MQNAEKKKSFLARLRQAAWTKSIGGCSLHLSDNNEETVSLRSVSSLLLILINRPILATSVSNHFDQEWSAS